MPTPHSDKVVAEALEEYQRNDSTTRSIAKKHHISASTLTVWAQKANLKLRPRGRRLLVAPNERHLAMLAMAEYATYEEVGKQFGCEKQEVHRVVKRWKNWAKPKKPPFVPNDIVLWNGKRMTVVSASQTSGTLIDENGATVTNLRWNQNGKLPKKLGHVGA